MSNIIIIVTCILILFLAPVGLHIYVATQRTSDSTEREILKTRHEARKCLRLVSKKRYKSALVVCESATNKSSDPAVLRAYEKAKTELQKSD
ncbi:hypothetical protein [Dongshaea marina]|uniref:hypothetical protein n=1 Tax=Dongshaea marina TaxID=2047966 RepID=UPI00131F2698|nr:hypothetical protein [Dongshaea marina]